MWCWRNQKERGKCSRRFWAKIWKIAKWDIDITIIYQQTDGVAELMRNRKLQFYGYLIRIDRDRLTKRIWVLQLRKTNSFRKWELIRHMRLKGKWVMDRHNFRKQLKKWNKWTNEKTPVVRKTRMVKHQDCQALCIGGLPKKKKKEAKTCEWKSDLHVLTTKCVRTTYTRFK